MRSIQERIPAEGIDFFERVFERYHHPSFISPDPLEFLYRYRSVPDREIAGLIASALAYGRVAQILKSVECVLKVMGSSPRAFLEDTSEHALRGLFSGFKHRFTTGRELAEFLLGIRDMTRRYGSLQACFLSFPGARDETVIPALAAFAARLRSANGGGYNSLVPDPGKGSACKRLHLFLRWMVRSDEIDPGGWEDVSPSRLIVPLDTHMFRICTLLGMTSRSQADIRTANEITEGFRKISRTDPVKYDFSLTRIGIRKEENLADLIERYGGGMSGHTRG